MAYSKEKKNNWIVSTLVREHTYYHSITDAPFTYFNIYDYLEYMLHTDLFIT